MDTVLLPLLLQFVLIFLNAVFACAEIAVISVNEAKIQQLAEKGNKKASKLQKLVNDPAKFLATIQVAITLSGFLGSAFAADNFSVYFTEWLKKLGLPFPPSTLQTISVIIITLILSYITLVFGELVPKRIAMKKAESLALKISSPVSLIAKFFKPLVWLLTVSTNAILRLCGLDPHEEDDKVSEEEIRLLVDEGSRKGVIDDDEKEMIQNIFEFDDLQVGKFATHRQDVDFLLLDDSVEKWNSIIIKTAHNYYPICDKTADSVVGVLYAALYFRLEDKSKENIMKNAVKPAWFIPETLKADVVFKRMKKNHQHFAVVLDEYGGMTSVVTINDLLEQLVGDFTYQSQVDSTEEITEGSDGTWNIRGSAALSEVAEKLEIELPVTEYDTFGGYVFGIYGSIPGDGSEFTVETPDLRIVVTEVKDRRVIQTVVSRIKKDSDSKDESEKSEKSGK